MKKFLSSLLLLPALVFVQSLDNPGPVIVDKKVVCDKIEVVVTWLTDYEKQKPMWVGTTENDGFIGVIIDEKTGAWTVIEFNNEYACILGSGLKNILTSPLY